jgi:hypothetical protein
MIRCKIFMGGLTEKAPGERLLVDEAVTGGGVPWSGERGCMWLVLCPCSEASPFLERQRGGGGGNMPGGREGGAGSGDCSVR